MRAQYERDASELVTSDELTASMGVSRFIVPRLTGRLGVNLSYINRVGALTLGSTEALQTADFRLVDEDLISFFDIKFILDLRDGLYDARSGFYATVGADIAFANTASDVSFTRLSGDFRGYIKVASWLTFATRLRLGINLFPAGQGTPEQARFTAGGQGSNRGFSNGHMGDYACDTGSADADGVESFINQGCGDTVSERTYIGGNYLVDSSAELRFYLSDLWSLVAFADVGQLWSKADQIALDDLVLSTGPGVRLLTPVGPLRLDLGIRTTGEGTGEIRLHFSLGQAF
jgi:outer membrane protein assembly factor BamA